MKVEYRWRCPRRWTYWCREGADPGHTTCWTVQGPALDEAVEKLFLQTMVPGEIELSLAVEREVESQSATLDRQWKARLEQVRYDARHAERRYKAVDPDNRVVARTLEREWEERLREVQEVEQQYEEARRIQHVDLTEDDRARIRAIARDLPAVWRAATTTWADRKAMLRLVIEAIGVYPVEVPERQTHLRVQWQGGAITDLYLPRPSRQSRFQTSKVTRERLRVLAASGLHDEQIAETLNAEGLLTGRALRWTLEKVRVVRHREAISRVASDRPHTIALPDRDAEGMYSVPGAARRLGVSTSVVHNWLDAGVLQGTHGPWGRYRSVWHIKLDQEDTAARLRARSDQRGRQEKG